MVMVVCSRMDSEPKLYQYQAWRKTTCDEEGLYNNRTAWTISQQWMYIRTHSIQPDMYQSKVCCDWDVGPCYMPDSHKLKHRFDIKKGKMLEEKFTNTDLVTMLWNKQPSWKLEKIGREVSESRYCYQIFGRVDFWRVGWQCKWSSPGFIQKRLDVSSKNPCVYMQWKEWWYCWRCNWLQFFDKGK